MGLLRKDLFGDLFYTSVYILICHIYFSIEHITSNHLHQSLPMVKYAAGSERLWLQALSVDDHLDGFHGMMSDEKAISAFPTYPTLS